MIIMCVFICLCLALALFSCLAGPRTTLRAVVVDPEVVFVANLKKSDAPALVASFHCDFTLHSEEAAQVMKVNLGGLKVLACPFIRNKDNKAVTTVRFANLH